MSAFTKIKKYLFILPLLWASVETSYAQGFVSYFEDFIRYSNPYEDTYNYEKGAEYLTKFKAELKQSLERNFYDAYAQVKEMNAKLIINESPDKKVISIDWDDMSGGTMRFFDGIYVLQMADSRYVVKEKYPPCKEDACLNPYTYGIYQVTNKQSQNIYVFFNVYVGSTALSSHFVNFASLTERGDLIPVNDIVVEGRQKSSFISYEMDWTKEVNVNNEVEEEPFLKFDTNGLVIMVPRFDDNGQLLRGSHKYVFNGQSFEKFIPEE